MTLSNSNQINKISFYTHYFEIHFKYEKVTLKNASLKTTEKNSYIFVFSFFFSAAIEQAIQDDLEIRTYLNDATRIYRPALPYDDPQ